MKTLRFPLAFATAVCALSATSQALDETINIDGSSTVYPITKLAGEAFQEKTKSAVRVNVSFVGTTAGFRKFIKGETDIQNASRPILKEEIAEAKANGVDFIEIPLAFDALTIAINPANTWLRDIKTSELKKLWEAASEGKVTKWNQIRPEWPDAEIKLFGAGIDSGTYDYFSEVITGSLKNLRKDYAASEDDNDLVKGIAADPYALGFIPFSYFAHEGDKLKAVAIVRDYDAIGNQKLASVPVLPSHKGVLNGQYTPLARPLFLYVSVRSLDQKPYLTDFLTFFLMNAGRFIYEANYLPISGVAYSKAIKDVQARDTGTRFGGEAVPSVSIYDIFVLPTN